MTTAEERIEKKLDAIIDWINDFVNEYNRNATSQTFIGNLSQINYNNLYGNLEWELADFKTREKLYKKYIQEDANDNR